MAVGLILDFNGGTLAQYDRIMEMMPGGRLPKRRDLPLGGGDRRRDPMG